MRCLAHVSIRGGEKTSLNRKLLLYMLQVTQRISSAAQHYRFQLILISTDVASLSQETGSFLCKLKLLDQGRDGWKLWNGQNDTHRSLQVTVSVMLKSFINACNAVRIYFRKGLSTRIIRRDTFKLRQLLCSLCVFKVASIQTKNKTEQCFDSRTPTGDRTGTLRTHRGQKPRVTSLTPTGYA